MIIYNDFQGCSRLSYHSAFRQSHHNIGLKNLCTNFNLKLDSAASQYTDRYMMAWLNHFTKIILLLLCYSLYQVRSEAYYIETNSSDLCTLPCQTLYHVVTNLNDLLDSEIDPNITLVFNPGIHYLNISVAITNTSDLSMLSKSEYSTPQIVCENYSRFIFRHLKNLHISNLEFIGCGGNKVEYANRFVVHETLFRGQEYSGTTFKLMETAAIIINCTFTSSRNAYDWSSYPYYVHQFGNIITATQSNVSVSQSVFQIYEEPDSYYDGVIYAEQQSIITINGSMFIGNSGLRGIVYSHSCNITIRTSEFYNNNISYGKLLSLYSSNVTIEQSVFEKNNGRVLHFWNSIVKIETSEFYNNSASDDNLLTLYGSNATIEQSMFENNIGSVLYF